MMTNRLLFSCLLLLAVVGYACLTASRCLMRGFGQFDQS
jgi:hypothetical protein